MREFNSLKSFFNYINKEIDDYVILRGVEEFDKFSDWDSNKDIDLLCVDVKRFVEYIEATPLFGKDDCKHYKVFIAGKRIILDFITIYDNEFDGNWIREMIGNREQDSTYLCYVLNDENYRYSLIYHGLIHKGTISEKYKKLSGIYFDTMAQYDKMLWQFMKEKKYKYVIKKGKENEFFWEFIHSDCVSFAARYMRVKTKLIRKIREQIKI